MHAFFYQLVFLALAINAGECLKCYVCESTEFTESTESTETTESTESTESKICLDPFEKKDIRLKQCSSGNVANVSAVLKIAPKKDTTKDNVKPNEFLCIKVNVTQNKRTWLVRSCIGKPTSSNFCKMLIDKSKSDGKGKYVNFCRTCRKDSCNGVGNVQAVFLAIFMACTVFILPQLF